MCCRALCVLLRAMCVGGVCVLPRAMCVCVCVCVCVFNGKIKVGKLGKTIGSQRMDHEADRKMVCVCVDRME